jgi:hypothetical protein
VDYREQAALAAVGASASSSSSSSSSSASSGAQIHEPSNEREAFASPERAEWIAAMKAELASIHANHTWSEVSAAAVSRSGRRPIGCKWVFKVKRRSDGSVDRFKARLVAKGFSQQAGIDYHEVFAPVMKYKSLRVLLTLVARGDMELQQMDVETAFLNGRMEEEVYMKRPPGMEVLEGEEGRQRQAGRAAAAGGDDRVLLLHRALYGTKQASRQWYLSIKATIEGKLGFKQCVSDPCVWHKQAQAEAHAAAGGVQQHGNMYIGLFVDDMLLAYDHRDAAAWLRVKSSLCSTYAMKDLGAAEWILGMKIRRQRQRRVLELDQQLYISKMLRDYEMEASKEAASPEEVSCPPLCKSDAPQTEEEREVMRGRPYMELVGSLLYASVSTRPDIAHAVGVCSRFMAQPGDRHWKAAKRVLRYLQGTQEFKLRFGDFTHLHQHTKRNQQQERERSSDSSGGAQTVSSVSVYCDSDWGGDPDDRRSTSGCVILLHGCPVVWLSKKQITVALSTAEAEYMAMSVATQEVKWLTALLSELGEAPQLPITFFTDNQAAVSISSNEAVPHTRTKHIDLRHHYVRECVQSGYMRVEWIRSEEQLADVLTKGLNKQQHKLLTQAISNQEQDKKKQQ